MTVCTPRMSSPRAATSVAIKNFAAPLRKSSRASSRWACERFPWSSAALRPHRPKRILSLWLCSLVREKTMHFSLKVREHSARRIGSLSAPCPPLSRTTSCTMSTGVFPAASALRRTGFFRERLARFLTSSVMVAEKSSVCRLRGHIFTISWSSSLNPISRRRSASSSTSTLSSSSPTDCVLRRWSISRPGVATTMSGRLRSTAACTERLSPPTTSALDTSVNCASFCVIECTCTASSRVGVRMRTRV
mmetsp:Transcript_33931/g.107805  ORF Transcript_33931/g.107805 Transcript_33931/m.107805 type:complete len:248 (-) Transcript_33931:647-1390(-)